VQVLFWAAETGLVGHPLDATTGNSATQLIVLREAETCIVPHESENCFEVLYCLFLRGQQAEERLRWCRQEQEVEGCFSPFNYHSRGLS
jgi:hypothetical protein